MKEQQPVCNKCGRKLHMEQGLLKEDALIIRKEWGYFSKKDLEVHFAVLCEECYDALRESFAVPVRVEKKKEVLS